MFAVIWSTMDPINKPFFWVIWGRCKPKYEIPLSKSCQMALKFHTLLYPSEHVFCWCVCFWDAKLIKRKIITSSAESGTLGDTVWIKILIPNKNSHNFVNFRAIWLKFYIQVDETFMKLCYFISHPSKTLLKYQKFAMKFLYLCLLSI